MPGVIGSKRERQPGGFERRLPERRQIVVSIRLTDCVAEDQVERLPARAGFEPGLLLGATMIAQSLHYPRTERHGTAPALGLRLAELPDAFVEPDQVAPDRHTSGLPVDIGPLQRLALAGSASCGQ